MGMRMNYSLSSGTNTNTVFIWKNKKQSSNEKRSNVKRAIKFVIKKRTGKTPRFQRTQNTLLFIHGAHDFLVSREKLVFHHLSRENYVCDPGRVLRWLLERF